MRNMDDARVLYLMQTCLVHEMCVTAAVAASRSSGTEFVIKISL